MAKKLYMTIETDRPLKTLDKLLDSLQTEPGVTYADGRIGWSGSTVKRRYELEGLVQGKQPEDYAMKPKGRGRRKR